MSDEIGLSERQRREREYYDQFSIEHRDGDEAEVDLAPISGGERRPFNSYWRLFELVQDRFRPGARLLDFGCGWGTNTVLYAKIGYEVEGFDISEVNLAAARKAAAQYDVADKITFSIQTAEALKYPDESFDVIAGIDILHHVEIEPSLRECRRVLKPGGVAFFREPLANPVFDALRNTALMRRLVPNEVSFDRHITHDERKVTSAELKAARAIFPQNRVDRFRVLSRLGALWPSGETALEKLDYGLRPVPGYHWFAGAIVTTFEKP